MSATMDAAAGAECRGLAWAHGCLAVQRLGAMLAPLTFVLGDGRQVSPLHVAPWAEEPGAAAWPGVLRRLRGEWPCVPFGESPPADGFPADWAQVMGPAPAGEELHGHCSNHPWQWDEGPAGELRLSIEDPAGSPVRRVARRVRPDPDAPAVDVEFAIEIRAACRLPIALHPVLRLPERAGAARIEPGRFDHGLTYPGVVEPTATIFASGQRFTDLAAVPAHGGGVIDASRVPPPARAEDLVQLNGVDGSAALANAAEGYRVRLRWQPEHFPSLLLWYSNRGHPFAPWNGRHVALGMEPLCSPFGLGPETAAADNPLARTGVPTARDFAAGETFVTRYRIEVEPL